MRWTLWVASGAPRCLPFPTACAVCQQLQASTLALSYTTAEDHHHHHHHHRRKLHTHTHACTHVRAQPRRGGAKGNDERDQTLNQMLSEMDGFDSELQVRPARPCPPLPSPAPRPMACFAVPSADGGGSTGGGGGEYVCVLVCVCVQGAVGGGGWGAGSPPTRPDFPPACVHSRPPGARSSSWPPPTAATSWTPPSPAPAALTASCTCLCPTTLGGSRSSRWAGLRVARGEKRVLGCRLPGAPRILRAGTDVLLPHSSSAPWLLWAVGSGGG